MADEADRHHLLLALEARLELPMVVLSFVWVGLFVAETMVALGAGFRALGAAIWAVFILDFGLRFWVAPRRSDYLRSNWLTAVSLMVPALRMFRLFRALVLLRSIRGVQIVQVAGAVNRALVALGHTFQRRGFGYVVAATASVLLLAAAAMLLFEPRAPGFDGYGDALWWAAMMLLSVGSEVWPETAQGRAVGFLLALYGFVALGYVAATLTSFFVDREADQRGAGEELRMLQAEVRALREELEARSPR